MKWVVGVVFWVAALAPWARADDVCRSDVPLLSRDSLAALQAAHARYAHLANNRGWAEVPLQPSMQAGFDHPHVLLLRQRLTAEGDLPGANLSGHLYDDAVVAGVKRFQQRYGLPVTGIADRNTLAAMNVPAATRLEALRHSLRRLSTVAARPPGRRVTVNIPAALVQAVENGRVVAHYTAVVGSADYPSPELSSVIDAVNFHPGWTVPPSIVKEDLAARLREEPDYLTRYGYQVFNARGQRIDPARVDWSRAHLQSYSFRVPAGRQTPLGKIRLSMPNDHSVYIHDTTRPGVFGLNLRYLTTGCVRLEGIAVLAAWLLGQPPEQIRDILAEGKPQTVALPKPVPVDWVYAPVWSTPAATCFRPDIYGKDTSSLLMQP